MADFFYFLVVKFVRLVKAIERVFINLSFTTTKRIITKVYKNGGVRLNGSDPWDIQVHNEREFHTRVAENAPMGLGETYMEGHWSCEDLVEMVRRLLRNGIYRAYMNPWNRFLNYLELYYFDLQTEQKVWEVGEKHYDLGNDFYKEMLDPTMNYTCGYWRRATNLNEAQIHKMDLIAKKLMLKPGMTVLDLGCGWGGLSKHLAENYGVSCVGVTISKEGAKYGQEICKGLPVDIRLADYRNLDEQFDRVVCIGMMEHVGHNNYDHFFKVAHRCLKEDGIFLLHTIGVAHHDIPCTEPWYHTYIFPNGILPYYKHISDGIEKKFIIEDWHNMGNDYYKTLMAWNENFLKSWPKFQEKYGEKFFRMWQYYLLFSAGCFKSRRFQLWQVVLSKNGIEGGYYAAR